MVVETNEINHLPLSLLTTTETNSTLQKVLLGQYSKARTEGVAVLLLKPHHHHHHHHLISA